jgi:Protein of unknown function (DUF778)
MESLPQPLDDCQSHASTLSPFVVMKCDIDPARQRYPYCIVWSPLPVITWFFPFIGHTGVADSAGKKISISMWAKAGRHVIWLFFPDTCSIWRAIGVIFDFAGPYTIGRGNFTFGKRTHFFFIMTTVADVFWFQSFLSNSSLQTIRCPYEIHRSGSLKM